MDDVRRITDAVLYEGYILWPYRKSALKNQQRWTFGGVYPTDWSARHPDDPSSVQAQILLEGGGDARVDVSARFLHVVERQVLRATDGGLEPVEELEVGDERHVSWQEAVEREITVDTLSFAGGAASRRVPIHIEAARRSEELAGGAGAIERSWRALVGEVVLDAEQLRPGLFRLTVRIENATPGDGGSRQEALRETFCSTHAVLRAQGGAFVSLADPPDDLRDVAEACENRGVWPVLVGEEGDRSTMLASPIILSDHPELAPESPGDLFDSGEIDQMLVHNILAMTDEERRDMRDADPRTREILERTEALTNEEKLRLHGRTAREFGLVRDP